MGGLLARVARRPALAQIRYVAPVRPGAAPGPVAEVYAQMERDFGMLAPPVALHAAAPDILAAIWLMLRESTLVPGALDRAAKEAIATAVSAANACPYCVEVHGTTLAGLTGNAVAAGRIDAIRDPALRAIATWAAGGRPPRPPALSAAQAAEAVGVLVTFHYLNRMVNVFLRPSPLPPGLPDVARGQVRRMVAPLLGSLAARPVVRDAPSPASADAFARTVSVVEAAGTRVVPEAVRALLHKELADWDGQPRGSDLDWVERAVAVLPRDDRPAGRLAMHLAFASYRVPPSLVARFPDDRALIELTSWSSLTAARLLGVRAAGADSLAR